MARSVNQIEHIALSVGMSIEHPDGSGLNGNTALTLNIHRIEELLLHIAGVDGVGVLHKPVGKR